MRILVLTLFFLTLLCIPIFAQSESMTMTTFYPAPFGAYDIIRLIPRSGPPSTCADGTMYVDKNDNNTLHICGVGGSGTNSNLSVWMESGTNIYPTQGTGQDVGIGTETPSGKLEVAGGSAVFEDIDASGAAAIGGNVTVSGNVSATNVTASSKVTTATLTFTTGGQTGDLQVKYDSGKYYAVYAP